jgi:hypothetical protein
MESRLYQTASGLLFALVCLGHGLRIIYGWPMTIGAYVVPMWFSWAAVAVTAVMTVWAITILARDQ